MRHYLGYGYGLIQGHAPFGPPVLSHQRQEGKVYMLRVHDQAKQAAHSGPPRVALAFSRNSHSTTPDSEQENNK
jgi:hypothetical protein